MSSLGFFVTCWSCPAAFTVTLVIFLGSPLQAPLWHLSLTVHWSWSSHPPPVNGSCLQEPFSQLSLVQTLWSSQLAVHVGGGDGGGASPHPETITPEPVSETITEPSSLTRAVPPDANSSKSWL